MIYLDSSGLLKLAHQEGESAALRDWLSARQAMPLVSSELAKVEVIRACRRVNADALPNARALLGQLNLIPLTTDVLEDAAELDGRALRGLDALHLASALSIREDLSSFIAYDRRLSEAASNLGLDTIQPGR